MLMSVSCFQNDRLVCACQLPLVIYTYVVQGFISFRDSDLAGGDT